MPPSIADAQEAEAFLDAHPQMQFFDLVYTGLSGVPRGKRLRRSELAPLYQQGRFLPSSLLVSDITGRDVEETGFIWEEGDKDRVARPIAGRLTAAPWLGNDVAQIPVSAYEQNGAAFDLDPRHVLARVIDRFAADSLTPVVACELEFYLLDTARDAQGRVQLARWPMSGRRPAHHDQYALDELAEAMPLLRELWAACDAMGLPLEGAIGEYGPGQLEITLRHRNDALAAADDAVLFKRAAKGVALKHDCEATFMAKPFAQFAGSGLHVHVSIDDAQGANIFAADNSEGAPPLRHAIGGLQALLGESMAVLAPNANSYRRFKANSYAPVAPLWGVDNRTCAFRVPAGAPQSRRIEHRVAGADAHPALALAVLLAGVHHGLTNALDPGPPVAGNGYEAAAGRALIPANWPEALGRFSQSALLADYLGEAFVRTYATVKQAEHDRYQSVVPDVDYEWYGRAS